MTQQKANSRVVPMKKDRTGYSRDAISQSYTRFGKIDT